MNSIRNTSRVLGAAFLFQAITSLTSGLVQMSLTVPGNITESMIKIANHAGLMRATIFDDMMTALGVIFLGAILYLTLRKQNETVTLVALGFYVFESAIICFHAIAAFVLLRISQAYATAGHPANLQTIGNLALESMNFGSLLLMLPFCVGAILFYYLFYESRLIPRVLSLWGLISVALALLGTLSAVLGYTVPFFVFLPYLPFEFVVGVWILVKGINGAPEVALQIAPTRETH